MNDLHLQQEVTGNLDAESPNNNKQLWGVPQPIEQLKAKYAETHERRKETFLAKREEKKNKPVLSTGFDNLDKLLGGGLYDDLYIIGAESSLGKTTLCLQIADNIAKQGTDVMFISLEMTGLEIYSKSISRITYQTAADQAHTAREIMQGEVESESINNAIEEYFNDYEHLYLIEAETTSSVEGIRQHIEAHKELTGNNPVVIIDYLQYIQKPDEYISEKEANFANIKTIKQIKKDLDMPVIVISSFNRESYSEYPTMKSFKECGDIEYTIDKALAIMPTAIDQNTGKKDIPEKMTSCRQARIKEISVLNLKGRLDGYVQERADFKFVAEYNCFEEVKNKRQQHTGDTLNHVQ